jgi:hypothetical protein
MWYSGIAVTITSSPSFTATGMKALNCSVLATRLRCDSAAPLDSPVVPPVYCRNSRSSPVSATGVQRQPAPWASASAKETDSPSRASTGGLGRWRRWRRPGPTVMTVFRPVLARTSASVGVEPLKMTIVSTPAVLELVLELARRVQRVHVHLHRTGAHDAEQRGERQQVRHHHRDAVALGRRACRRSVAWPRQACARRMGTRRR